MRRLLPLATFAAVLGFGTVRAADPPTATEKVSYYRDVRPIFMQNCQGCHQPAKANGGYVMTDLASLQKAGEAKKPGIVPGKPEASYLVREITLVKGKAEMPKGRDPLSAVQVKLIAEWIRQGATDDTPASAKTSAIDAAHPPVYRASPVVTSLAYSPNGQFLAVAGYHEILLHKADGSAVVARLVGLSERIQSLAFSPDGKFLAASAGDPGRVGEIQIWDVEKQKLKSSTPLTFDTLYGVSWSPDGTTIAVGCSDNTVRAIDTASGDQVLQMGTHSDWALGTAFSQDGQHLVSVSRDMSVKLTEVTTQRFVDNVTSITPGALKGGLMAIDRRPTKEKKMAAVPADTPNAPARVYDEILIGGADGAPRLYKMHREKKREIGDDSNKITQYEAMPGRITSLAFAADGVRFAVTSSLDGKGEVRIYATATAAKKIVCEKITGPAYSVSWAPNGKQIASAGFDGLVWIHDAATGKLVKQFAAVPLTPAK